MTTEVKSRTRASKTASLSSANETATSRARPRRETPTDDAVNITTATFQHASGGPLSAEERHRLVAEAAYFRALQRGFAGGSPEDDWFAAEAEIEARLSQRDPPSRASRS